MPEVSRHYVLENYDIGDRSKSPKKYKSPLHVLIQVLRICENDQIRGNKHKNVDVIQNPLNPF